MRAFLLRSIKYNRQSVHLIDTLGGGLRFLWQQAVTLANLHGSSRKIRVDCLIPFLYPHKLSQRLWKRVFTCYREQRCRLIKPIVRQVKRLSDPNAVSIHESKEGHADKVVLRRGTP